MSLQSLYTDKELLAACAICDQHRGSGRELNQKLIDAVVTPALPRINAATGQDNNPEFFAYVLQHAHAYGRNY